MNDKMNFIEEQLNSGLFVIEDNSVRCIDLLRDCEECVLNYKSTPRDTCIRNTLDNQIKESFPEYFI